MRDRNNFVWLYALGLLRRSQDGGAPDSRLSPAVRVLVAVGVAALFLVLGAAVFVLLAVLLFTLMPL